MSWWTYINGTITVYPQGRTQAEKRYILETILSHLPKVTGSEENMYVHIVQKIGYNSSNFWDEFEIPSDKEIKIQDYYILVFEASLRDRTFKETFKEFNKFLNRLAKRVLIENILVSVKDFSKEFIFKNEKPYSEMYEQGSYGENDKPAWWEYLMWAKGADTDLPMVLEYKYHNNLKNNEEYKRRKSWEENNF